MIEGSKVGISNAAKEILPSHQKANSENADCEQEQRFEANSNEDQSFKSGDTLQNDSKERDFEPIGNSSDEVSKITRSPILIQSKETSEGKLKPFLTASSSVKISVPANLPLSSSILNTPGNRFTARAKIICPEKNLEPLKSAPINVSFDGGKTFTLANIIEIRNRENQNITSESQANVESKKLSDECRESKIEKNEVIAEKPTTIDAVLLGYSTSETAKNDLTVKEDKVPEKKPYLAKKKKKITKNPWDTDDSSEDTDDPDFIEEKKEVFERLRSGEKSNKTPKELRRSSRFVVKNDSDKPLCDTKKEATELENVTSESIRPEINSDTVLSQIENDDSLSLDGANLKDENKKLTKRKISATNKVVSQVNNSERRERNADENKKTTQTSKDEMFDCCAIHQDLFCKKCLPFKEKEGLWPVSSRAKEINSAWRSFVRRCAKHDCAKCVECNEIENGRHHDITDKKDKYCQAARNKDYMTQMENEENATGKEVAEHLKFDEEQPASHETSATAQSFIHDTIKNVNGARSVSKLSNTKEVEEEDNEIAVDYGERDKIILEELSKESKGACGRNDLMEVSKKAETEEKTKS